MVRFKRANAPTWGIPAGIAVGLLLPFLGYFVLSCGMGACIERRVAAPVHWGRFQTPLTT